MRGSSGALMKLQRRYNQDRRLFKFTASLLIYSLIFQYPVIASAQDNLALKSDVETEQRLNRLASDLGIDPSVIKQYRDAFAPFKQDTALSSDTDAMYLSLIPRYPGKGEYLLRSADELKTAEVLFMEQEIDLGRMSVNSILTLKSIFGDGKGYDYDYLILVRKFTYGDIVKPVGLVRAKLFNGYRVHFDLAPFGDIGQNRIILEQEYLAALQKIMIIGDLQVKLIDGISLDFVRGNKDGGIDIAVTRLQSDKLAADKLELAKQYIKENIAKVKDANGMRDLLSKALSPYDPADDVRRAIERIAIQQPSDFIYPELRGDIDIALNMPLLMRDLRLTPDEKSDIKELLSEAYGLLKEANEVGKEISPESKMTAWKKRGIEDSFTNEKLEEKKAGKLKGHIANKQPLSSDVRVVDNEWYEETLLSQHKEKRGEPIFAVVDAAIIKDFGEFEKRIKVRFEELVGKENDLSRFNIAIMNVNKEMGEGADIALSGGAKIRFVNQKIAQSESNNFILRNGLENDIMNVWKEFFGNEDAPLLLKEDVKVFLSTKNSSLFKTRLKTFVINEKLPLDVIVELLLLVDETPYIDKGKDYLITSEHEGKTIIEPTSLYSDRLNQMALEAEVAGGGI